MSRQRGFTLIELMVALVVSSLLVGMILAIFSRMSLAYRGQQQIAGVQQVLAAARATIETDAKQAGLQLPQGFKLAMDGPNPAPRPAVSTTDRSDGPDQVAFFYADPTTQARVAVAVASWLPTPSVTVDSAAGFEIGNLVVLSTINGSIPAGEVNDTLGGADIATFDACVLRIQGIAGNTITFENVPPWGQAATDHCTFATTQTMLYRFVARAYRIDTSTPERAALGMLQQSKTGGLLQSAADAWGILAFGFTDIQTATRIYDDDAVDSDGDGDPLRDWHSDDKQVTAAPAPAAPIQMTISLVARTDRDIEGIATSQTPTLTVPAQPNDNWLGNHDFVTLPSATDPALMGSRIYRYTTFQVDLRNLGVGR